MMPTALTGEIVEPAPVPVQDLTPAARPASRWDQESIEGIVDFLPSTSWWPTDRRQTVRMVVSVRRLLSWLEQMPGGGWQERWEHAESMLGPQWRAWSPKIPETEKPSGESHHVTLTRGLACLLRVRIVRPSYQFLAKYGPTTTFAVVRTGVSPRLFARAADSATERGGQSDHAIRQALNSLTAMVIHTGESLDGITINDFLAAQAATAPSRSRARDGSHTAWQMMVDLGIFPQHSTLHAALKTGPQSTAVLLERYGIVDEQIRGLLIRYLDERRPAVDYSTFRGLVSRLAGAFWADIEHHHPGIATINLPSDVVVAWKERLRFSRNSGNQPAPQRQIDVFIAVRAFYLDVAEWALTDPSWAPWAYPSPVRKSDTAGVTKQRRAITARMHQRTRERLPHLPRLVDTAQDWKDEQAALLEVATRTEPGENFVHGETSYQRLNTGTSTGSTTLRPNHVLAEETADGSRINLTLVEDEAFWAWAVIETLRHTGVRIEELLELTHFALFSHRLPDTGELVPLLQIVPSKSAEERLLLVTPELASVLAAIISRIRSADGTVPLVSRYDGHERVTGPPLPHLFQRRNGFMQKNGWRNDVIGTQNVRDLLNRAIARTGLVDASADPLRYTPHDFRRMFATEVVTGGLPVHIAAKILGHANINTTQAYTAVFQDQLIRAYRSFVDERRALRPSEEYRDPTDAEWAEFQQHFHVRKLELGDCGRPYGTPCIHEHACVRCPMLRVDPRQRTRLTQIIRNLAERIDEAKANGWRGEVEGLKISLNAAQQKLVTIDRAARNGAGPTLLGMPAVFGKMP